MKLKIFLLWWSRVQRWTNHLGNFFMELPEIPPPFSVCSHTSMCLVHATSGVNCNCTFSQMNFNDKNALHAAAQFELGSLDAK
jgi:hypothetical protein